jgi:periplasmic glucans biosynthesis protein
MNRRNFIEFAGALSLAAFSHKLQAFAQAGGEGAPAIVGGSQVAATPQVAAGALETPFSHDWLVAHAEGLAKQPFVAQEVKTPKELSGLSYSAYKKIRAKPEEQLWKDAPISFRAEALHGSHYYKNPVRIYQMEGERKPAVEYAYSPSKFNFEAAGLTPGPDAAIGFSGFSLQTASDSSPNAFEECAIFQGATYFRALAKGQVYGATARGLAVNCGQPPGEEFPFFHSFWLVEPKHGDVSVTIYALLDSESVTGAYKFVLTPGRSAHMDVECNLFSRKALAYVGIAPLTTMYLHGPNERRRFDDYRPQVHDSDGLAIWNGAGEWIWRSLINPERLQFSAFTDNNIKGFGLLQRDRVFADYQDVDQHYGERPSVWVEPDGDWGEGSIDLLELPSSEESNQNVVAFWKPKNGLTPGVNHHYRYRLHWCWESPVRSLLAQVSQVRIGKGGSAGARRIVTEFMGAPNYDGVPLTFDVRASSGKIEPASPQVVFNPATGCHRIAFDFIPASGDAADIRGVLMSNGKPASEVWTFRWTA